MSKWTRLENYRYDIERSDRLNDASKISVYTHHLSIKGNRSSCKVDMQRYPHKQQASVLLFICFIPFFITPLFILLCFICGVVNPTCMNFPVNHELILFFSLPFFCNFQIKARAKTVYTFLHQTWIKKIRKTKKSY